MADDKKRKIDSGRAMLNSYQKRKHQSRMGDELLEPVYQPKETVSERKDGMDVITLQKKTTHLESLNLEIKHLRESLAEKNKLIESLEITNRALSEGKGDYRRSPYTLGGQAMTVDLQKKMESRDILITKLSKDLKQLSEEAKSFVMKEEQYNSEIQSLQKQLKQLKLNVTQFQTKLSNSFNEIIEYKAKINLLTNQNQVYANLIHSLKADLESNSKQIDSKKEELLMKNQEPEKLESEMARILEALHKYKDAYENQRLMAEELETKLNQLSNLNLELHESLEKLKQSEKDLLHELESKEEKLSNYEQKAYDFNEKLQLESNQIVQKYLVVITSFKKQILELTSELDRNKLYYDKNLTHLTSKVLEQEKEINILKNKITQKIKNEEKCDQIQYINREIHSSSQLEELDTVHDNISLAEYINESNKCLFQRVLKGLKNIRNDLQSIFYGSIEKEPEFEQTQSENENEYELIVQEIEQAMIDLQHILKSRNVILGGTFQDSMITSTTKHSDRVTTWMRKCASLENENERLNKELESLSTNLKEMEYCVLVATQESSSFNKKCQILDTKLTELENSKMSEYMLKKENNELKERLLLMEDAKNRFNHELEVLNDNNLKLEQMLSKNILNLQKEIAKSGSSLELDSILSHFIAKSEEVMNLKLQLVNLNKSEKDSRVKIFDIQSKNNLVEAQFKLLTSELLKKKKELEDLWTERNQIASENKLLNARLLLVKEKNPLQNSIMSDFSTSESVDLSSDGKDQKHLKNANTETEGFNSLPLRRLQTIRALSDPQNLSAKLSSISPKIPSLAERIGYHLELLDQKEKDTIYYMPTIPEEENEEEDNSPGSSSTALSKEPQVTP